MDALSDFFERNLGNLNEGITSLLVFSLKVKVNHRRKLIFTLRHVQIPD